MKRKKIPELKPLPDLELDETILGLDFSVAHTGLVCIDSGSGLNVLYSETIEPHPLKGYSRFSFIRDRLRFLLPILKPRHAFIEEYAFKAKGKARTVLQELGGVTNTMLHEYEVPAFRIAPRTLKKFATGSGNADKEDVIEGVLHHWGKTFEDDNQTDAYVLAKIGWHLLALDDRGVKPDVFNNSLTAPQLEVIKKLWEENVNK